jgi:hypothetical protein
LSRNSWFQLQLMKFLLLRAIRNYPAPDEIRKRYSNTAFKVPHRITGTRDDADDVIQDAWVKPMSHL